MTDRARWPELLREAAEALGEAAALRLAAELGGQRVHVPGKLGSARTDQPGRRAPAEARLAERLGRDLAAWLIEERGGDYVHIPRFSLRDAEARRKEVLASGHLSANDLAARLGVTSRRVEQIRSAARRDPDQPDLFE